MRKCFSLVTALLLVTTFLAVIPTASAAIYVDCEGGWQRIQDADKTGCCRAWTSADIVCETPQGVVDTVWPPVQCSTNYHPWNDGLSELVRCWL